MKYFCFQRMKLSCQGFQSDEGPEGQGVEGKRMGRELCHGIWDISKWDINSG